MNWKKKKKKKKKRTEKVIKRKGGKLYVKWKGYNHLFNSWIDKNDSINEWFPGPKSLGKRVKVELDVSNYVTKVDLKNATGVNTSKFTKKIDLVNLKSNADKLDIGKLKNVPTDLSNLKSTVDKLDADKLVPVPVDLSKLSDVVTKWCC